MYVHRFQAMSTEFQTIGLPVPIQAKVESWVRYVENHISRFSVNSELFQLNQANGQPTLCSDLLWEILSVADGYYHQTNGLFNPYMGRTISELGYNQSFDKLPTSNGLASKHQPPSQNARKEVSPILHPLQMDAKAKRVTLDSRVAVDLGGIAKGWSVQKMREEMTNAGVTCGLLDAGGDMVIWGNEDEQGWEVIIEDPFVSHQDLVVLRVIKEAGIATSNSWRRRWGEGKHHIIDPRTHQPCQSDFVQTTIFAPDLTTAEVYAKCLLLLGSEEGIPWMSRTQSHLAYLAVKWDGSIVMSSNLNDYAACTKIFEP